MTLKLLTVLLLVKCLCLTVPQCWCLPQDEIKSLPGLNGTVPFRQYSGYLDGGKGRRLFYWLAESEKSPADDPLVLWLNGGPGCSSLEGLFSENGPFRVQADGKSLQRDPFSWNAIANVLFLESPVNVGFSYLDSSSNLTEAELYNDEATVEAKYQALLDFFIKYPNLKKHKLYITGESYAGVYIPLLTRMILEKKKENDFNLQGTVPLTLGMSLVYTAFAQESPSATVSTTLTFWPRHASSTPTTMAWWA